MNDAQENPMRAAIVDHLQAEPGLSFTSLLHKIRGMPEFAASVGHGALAWHLARLERAHLISTRRWGPYRYYFPRGGPWQADLEACTLVQGNLRRPLAEALARSSGLTVDEIRARLPALRERTREAVHQQLRRLRAAGLVETYATGRVHRYEATPRLARVVAALAPAPLTRLHLAPLPPCALAAAVEI